MARACGDAFCPSSQLQENGVFKILHFGDRFHKGPFCEENPLVKCGREPKTDKKICVFKNIRMKLNTFEKTSLSVMFQYSRMIVDVNDC